MRTTWDRPRVKLTTGSLLVRCRCSATHIGTVNEFHSTSFGYWDGCVSTAARFGTVTEYANVGLARICRILIALVSCFLFGFVSVVFVICSTSMRKISQWGTSCSAMLTNETH